MDPVQVYETTLHERDGQRGFAFATVPARSLPEGDVPPAALLGRSLETEGGPLGPIEAWSLPFLVDALMGRLVTPFDEPYFDDPFFGLPWRYPGRGRSVRSPSAFAQQLAYAPVVPFESSPLGGKSLADIVTTAGGAASAYVTRDPLMLLTVPAGIIVCRAASHVGDGIGLALRAKILDWAGVQDQPPTPKPADEEG